MVIVPWGLIFMHKIMQLHHSRHHGNCVNKLNATKKKFKADLTKNDVIIQVTLQPALEFSGGGRPTLSKTNLSPNDGGEHKGLLLETIKCYFVSFDLFKKWTAVSVNIQGSDWGWFSYIK